MLPAKFAERVLRDLGDSEGACLLHRRVLIYKVDISNCVIMFHVSPVCIFTFLVVRVILKIHIHHNFITVSFVF